MEANWLHIAETFRHKNQAMIGERQEKQEAQRKYRVLGQIKRKRQLKICRTMNLGELLGILGNDQDYFLDYDNSALPGYKAFCWRIAPIPKINENYEQEIEDLKSWGQNIDTNAKIAAGLGVFKAAEYSWFRKTGVYWELPDFELDGVLLGDLQVAVLRDRDTIMVYGPKYNTVGKCHPHVSSNHELCLGDGKYDVKNATVRGDLLRIYDVVNTILNNYDPEGAYIKLRNFDPDYEEEDDEDDRHCENCDSRFDSEYEGLCTQDGYWYCDDCGTLCQHCNSVILRHESYSYDGEPYCDECYDELFTDCDKCWENVPRSDVHGVNSGGALCSKCRDEYCAKCESCEEIFYKTEMRDINGDYVCQNCVETCDHCGEICKTEDVVDGLCESCKTAKEEKLRLQGTLF